METTNKAPPAKGKCIGVTEAIVTVATTVDVPAVVETAVSAAVGVWAGTYFQRRRDKE